MSLNCKCLEKQLALKKKFEACPTPQRRYETMMEMGRALPFYPEEFKRDEFRVPGCQSILYLHAELKEGKIQFQAHSEALISAGLAAILLFVYNGESPESILLSPPHFLEELGISSSLSPSRSNGLSSLLKIMQKYAVKFLQPVT